MSRAGRNSSRTSPPMSRPSPSSADVAHVAHVAPLFAALGYTTRLALLDRLGSGGPQSITRLTVGSAVTRQAITKHLQILAAAGLVYDTRQGRERIWMLDTNRLAEAHRSLDHIAQHWDEALERL